MPYMLFPKTHDKYVYGWDPLNGDLTQITYLEQPPWHNYDIATSRAGGGAPVMGDNVPSRIKWNGPRRKLPDFDLSRGIYSVSAKLKLIVEKFEPDIHQFFPVELVWKNGDPAGNRYLFFVNVSLDGMHRDLTKISFNIIWEVLGHPYEDWIFDRTNINGHHVWMDKYIFRGIFVSDPLGRVLQDENVSGIGLQYIEEG